MRGQARKIAVKPAQKIDQLREMMRRWSKASCLGDEETATSWQRLTGEVGPRRLIDCLASTTGSGCGLIALDLCIQACRERGELVVIDSAGSFFPPAAVAWGVDAERLLLVRPSSHTDAIAATEVALRSPAVGAVVAWLGPIDRKDFRRLLLATEAEQAFGVLVRSARLESQSSWGDVQLRFDPIAGRRERAAASISDASPFLVRVTQTRNRHGPAGGSVILSIDWHRGVIQPLADDSHGEGRSENTRHLAARLAGATYQS